MTGNISQTGARTREGGKNIEGNADNEVLLLNLEDALTKEQLADYCKTFLEYESDEELSIESRIGWICKNARSTYSKNVEEAVEEIISNTNYFDLLDDVKECAERGDI